MDYMSNEEWMGLGALKYKKYEKFTTQYFICSYEVIFKIYKKKHIYNRRLEVFPISRSGFLIRQHNN